MTLMSTTQLVAAITAMGYRLSRRRLEGLIATGQVQAPPLVGPVRAWSPDDVANVRRVIESIDGTPLPTRHG